ncbi:hypothetical protein M430DRAFT_36942 [Amorphotheca resinae ATCC 22711]|uniref:CDP-diacylglycerol--glycerol-3-phosphate 3-phosphatidyltransferase n=1 Tax=Amorphotheca resinae ATCC 22711 TaxID=857342 RepID=A0A2T3ATB1_AMORE|nr:hypothetical protein M430DRAFT_36942 [Amorphotheca resinae ATCC 22711]PSS10692.1 hypothetical protein M430DRAFT_36942 [Amorphotheca resinae ATCC 22711]
MIVRSVIRCSATRRLQVWRPRLLQVKQCKYSTSSAVVTGNGPSQASILGTFTTELDRIAPRFEIQGSQIQILRSPSEFYETLKAKILNAKTQIFLSTLYIGKSEHELISTLQKALRATPTLKLSILTDALRGTRESPNPSCASLLAPLVAEFGPERVEIRMYHTPNLTGLRKKHVPKRINEGWGLQHMKLYGIDDEIIISGANLSNDYFTNRQDRYHVFSSKEITDYFFNIHNAVSNLSFMVTPDAQLPAGYVLEWPSSNSAPSPLADPQGYIAISSTIFNQLIQAPQSSTPPGVPKTNTTVYPLSQLTPLLKPDTSTELPAIHTILRILGSPTFNTSSWTFTAGYFNPDPSLTSLLLSTSSTSNTVITASPQANGFYGSKGVSGLLPDAYTLLSRRFLERIQQSPRHHDDIVLKEWKRGTVGEPGGWTYHAKGLWVSVNGEAEPSISIVGSSNYTKRSYSLDLEAGTLIVTSDEGLKARLREERDGLQEYARRVGMDEFVKTERRVGIHVRIALWIVGLVGGAL